jgi:aryl carrier-like protein
MYILDPLGEPVPVGVPGELYIGGAGVARGYWNRPELTAERFIASPFVDGDRLYKTGDVARYLADGNIEFLGRNDFQVKIRGFRVELGEIESRLSQHPTISESAVLAREDVPGEKQLVAYYTRSGAESEISAESLRAHLQETLPDYMVPAAYVMLETFPLTPNGKLDRKALPAPDSTSYTKREYESPRSGIESTIALIWADLLKVERISRHDNFFELGGHSLLIVKLIARMRSEKLHVDVQALFITSTLAGLAAATEFQMEEITVPANLISEESDVITPEMLSLWH